MIAPAALALLFLQADPEAQRHFERGLEAYAAHRYAEAIEELKRAFEIEPDRAYVFTWAQAERLRSRCSEAILLYEKFLSLDPPKDEADRAESSIARCRAGLSIETTATSTQTSTPPSVTPAPAAAAAAAVSPPPSSPSLLSDPWADALMLGGAVTAAVGVGFLVSAAAQDDEAQRAISYGDFRHLESTADKHRAVAIVCIASGAALIAGGALKLLLGGDGDKTAR
jgi:tetratricopeptide (TPR) repeat protein